MFSDADADAPHVREADLAVRLPGLAPGRHLPARRPARRRRRSAPAPTRSTPGYGFLSENAGFARAVLDAGLAWIGPPPDAIDAMGSKIEAKRLMKDAGVPVLDELDPADRHGGRPARADQGERGRWRARDARSSATLADLTREVELAQAEAQSAFGDPTVFCEPYLATGRHIEVQVMADTHGTVWAVGERECSIQRRHQKVVEEAPSPLVERVDGMRDALFDASRSAAPRSATSAPGRSSSSPTTTAGSSSSR